MKTLIIAGNHSIDSTKNIIFDEKSIEKGLVLKNENPNFELLYLIDNLSVNVEDLTLPTKSNKFIKKIDLILPEIKSQLPDIGHVIFESSLKNIAKNNKNKFCLILGRNSYRPLEETKICSCWGLMAIMVHSLLTFGFEKIIFVSSLDSKQLKHEDVLKTKQFFKDDDRLQIVWAK